MDPKKAWAVMLLAALVAGGAAQRASAGTVAPRSTSAGCCCEGPRFVILTTAGTGQVPWLLNPAHVESIDTSSWPERTIVRTSSGELREVEGTVQQVAALLGFVICDGGACSLGAARPQTVIPLSDRTK